MEKKFSKIPVSEFRGVQGIEYFDFEEDFIEKNIRCIPMIVRFKMDKAGIKLKLNEWSALKVNERLSLATTACSSAEETKLYRNRLMTLVRKRCGKEATAMIVDEAPGWADIKQIPEILREKLDEMKLTVSMEQWAALTDLQRFALLKLCRPGHENRNFPKAVVEFGLSAVPEPLLLNRLEK